MKALGMCFDSVERDGRAVMSAGDVLRGRVMVTAKGPVGRRAHATAATRWSRYS